MTDIIVFVFIGVSGKEQDKNHQYGHGKYETFATMLISFALVIIAVGIMWNGVNKVVDSINGVMMDKPGYIALYAALISIISKGSIKDGMRFIPIFIIISLILFTIFRFILSSAFGRIF